jgi:alpha-ketoglutaric semialdehyde dehydrogenase
MSNVLDRISTGPGGPVGVLVAGRPIAGSGAEEKLSSRVDGTPLAVLATAGPADVRAAFEAAAAAAPAWASVGPGPRATLLHRAASLFRQLSDDLGGVISAEMGKPRSEADAEVSKGAAVLDYYAELGYRRLGSTFATDFDEDIFTIVEPLGVVGLITPWNFPFTIPLRKLSAALTAGNTVVFKPSPHAALCGLLIGSVLLEAGLEAGVLQVVVGPDDVVGPALLGAPELAGVSLTGSYATAAAIRRQLPVDLPLQAELGGKNAIVVWRDADLDTAVDIIDASAFRNNGQICTSAGRLLAHEDIFDALSDRLSDRLLNLSDRGGGDELGILVSDREAERVNEFLALGDQHARRVLRPEWREGRVGPTVLVEPEAGPLTREEIFGPVVTLERVRDIDEAVAAVNDTAYGLTSGIVTGDLAVARRFWRGVRAGTVKVNAPLTGLPFHVPFEGWGHSGGGSPEGGEASLDFFTRTKTVYVRAR